jgi:hypothetical protein
LKRLEAFLPEMRRAMQCHAKGVPLGPDSSKARKPPTAKAAKKKADQVFRKKSK